MHRANITRSAVFCSQILSTEFALFEGGACLGNQSSMNLPPPGAPRGHGWDLHATLQTRALQELMHVYGKLLRGQLRFH